MISCQNGVLLEHKPQMSTVKWLKSMFGRSAYFTVLSRTVTLKLPSKKLVSNSPFIKLSQLICCIPWNPHGWGRSCTVLQCNQAYITHHWSCSEWTFCMEISSSDPEDKYGQGFSKQEISPIHWTVPLVLVVLVSCVHFGICFIMDLFVYVAGM